MSDMAISPMDEDLYPRADPLPEDSLLLKVLCCIPILGIVPQIIKDSSIQNQIRQTKEVPRLIHLIDLKNNYKICSLVRNILSTAIPFFGIVFLVCGVVDYLRINHNERIITELTMKGYRPALDIR